MLAGDVILAVLVGLALAGPAEATAETASVHAVTTSDKIDVDGRLDEPAWRSAGMIADLVQQAPNPGEPTPFTTTVRFLVSEDTLYVAVECFDPEPDKIALHEMQRDGTFEGDDNLGIIFDTFGDGRGGYLFRINAAGTLKDGLIADPEAPANGEWDGVWSGRVHRGASGWTAELAIPSLTLRFTPGRDVWGFNIQRRVPREQLSLRWTGLTLDSPFYDLRRTGELRGVGELRQGRGWSIAPYGLLRGERDRLAGRSATSSDIGADVSYALSSGLSAVLTVNTDFAETEVDTRQVNLTRFSLFFPEKRAFFLDGANQFEFGLGLDEDFIPFFSRRIGLFDGEPVPIRAGVKLVGRQGRFGIAVLDAVTGDVPATAGRNLFAGRFTYDVDEHLRIGTIVTDGDPDGLDDNRLYGVDAVWRTSTFRGGKNLAVGVWYAGTDSEHEGRRRDGWGLKLDYPNDRWDVSLTVKSFGDALDPGLGFLPRPGTRWWRVGSAFQPRPAQGWWAAWVRQFFFELVPSLVTNLDGTTESWRVFTAPFNAETLSGEHLELNWAPQYERLTEPFEIAEGVVIPPGDYRFTRYRVEIETSRHRPWRVASETWFGEFYSGRLVQWENQVSYTTPAGRLQLELALENNFGDLPGGDFIQRLWQLKAVYAFTPDLIATVYAQYDSETRNLGLNSRFRWTIRPGTDLFVVFNRGWQRPLGERQWDRLTPVADQAVVKLRWTFRA